MANEIHVSRSKEKTPVAAQAHTAILKRYGLEKSDLEAAHTPKSWRWKVVSAEGRRKVKAKNGGGKKPADKPASPSGGGGKKADDDKPKRRTGGITIPEQAFKSDGKGYLLLCGGRGRRATSVKYFGTVSEARRQASDKAASQAKGNVVLLQILNAVNE